MASKRPHGTSKRYDHGPDENDQPGKGCRCTRCGTAKSRAQKSYRLDKLAHGYRQVDAEPARRHVLALRDGAGFDLQCIARAAGVSMNVLDYLVYGRPSKELPPAVTIRREHAAALLAVRSEDLKPSYVPVAGTQRRLRALALAGWPMHAVATRSGVDASVLERAVRALPSTKVSARTADRVRTVCSALWMVDATTAGVSLGVVNRLKRVSAAKGWVSLLAWDDIDDPDATPQGVAQAVDA